MNWHLTLYYPIPSTTPLADLDINPNITSIRVTTTLPGGFNTLDVGLLEYESGERFNLPQGIRIVPGAHAVLTYGSITVFEGRVLNFNKRGGWVRGFSAVSYGIHAVHDGYFTSSDTVLATSGEVLQQALAAAAPFLTPGGSDVFVDPGVAHAPQEFDGMTPGEIVDALSIEGGDNGAAWYYAVWENRTVTFAPLIEPDVPDYEVPFNENVQWEEDWTNVYNEVAVRYTINEQPYLTTYASTEVPVDGFPNRRFVVDGGELTTTAAEQLRDATLAKVSLPSVAARIVYQAQERVPRAGGGGALLPLVRSGQYVQIGDERMLPITFTEYDCIEGTLTIELGEASTTLWDAWQQQVSENIAKFRTGINPNSGKRRGYLVDLSFIAQADLSDITDSTGGTDDGTLANTGNGAANDNFATVSARINQIMAAMRSAHLLE